MTVGAYRQLRRLIVEGAVDSTTQDSGRALLVRVWFEDESRLSGFRARVVTNEQMYGWPGAGAPAGSSQEVLELVGRWLDVVVEAGPENDRQREGLNMTGTSEEDFELSEEEFDVDPSAQDVEVSEVQTPGNAEVPSQDPEASGGRR